MGTRDSGAERLDWLRRAVAQAQVRAPGVALDLAEVAAPSMPPGPERDELLALTLEPLLMAGRLPEAEQRGRSLLGSVSPRARLDALGALRLAAEVEGRWEDALAAAVAVADAPEVDVRTRADMLGSAAAYHLVLGRVHDADRCAQEAHALGITAGSPGAVSAALRTRSWIALARGDCAVALADAEQAVSAARSAPKNRLPELALGLALAAHDRLPEAERVLVAAQRGCEDRGWLTAVPYYRGAVAVVEYLQGRVEDEAAPPYAAGLGLLVPAVASRRRLHRGDVEGALALVAAARAVRPSLWTAGWLEWVELLAAEASGTEDLAPLAAAAAVALVQAELLGPWAVAAPDAVRLGTGAARDDLVRHVEQGSRRARTAGAAGCALHCAALAGSDWSGAARAAQRLAEAGRPLAQARALEDAAALAPAARRPSLLQEAVATYSRCGAVADVRRCRASLPERLSRPTGLEALTTAERGVVELVATGLTNQQIAACLHVSPRTVQAHLSNVFVKLDVRSRAMVAARVVAERSRIPDS